MTLEGTRGEEKKGLELKLLEKNLFFQSFWRKGYPKTIRALWIQLYNQRGEIPLCAKDRWHLWGSSVDFNHDALDCVMVPKIWDDLVPIEVYMTGKSTTRRTWRKIYRNPKKNLASWGESLTWPWSTFCKANPKKSSPKCKEVIDKGG